MAILSQPEFTHYADELYKPVPKILFLLKPGVLVNDRFPFVGAEFKASKLVFAIA